MIYEPICEQQQVSCLRFALFTSQEFAQYRFFRRRELEALMRWSLERTEEILHSPSSSGWNTRWLEVLNEADRDGDLATGGLGKDDSSESALLIIPRYRTSSGFCARLFHI